jgi:endonuclease/exonuclease/phosphatase family metal-dependent hydrolase
LQNLWWVVVWVTLSCPAPSVEVCTWNLQWFPGRSSRLVEPKVEEAHIAEIQQAIRRVNPDIIALQEVRNLDAATAAVKEVPGMKVHIVSRWKSYGSVGWQQAAICSKYKALAAWSEHWDRGWASAPRGFAFAVLEINKEAVLVYALHLKSNLGDAVENTSKREDALEQLLQHIQAQQREYGARKVVIAGDFNTSFGRKVLHGERSFDILEKAGYFWTFEGVPFNKRITCPSTGKYPDACFDHVFTRGLGRPIAQVVDEKGSDHLPVTVEIRLD